MKRKIKIMVVIVLMLVISIWICLTSVPFYKYYVYYKPQIPDDKSPIIVEEKSPIEELRNMGVFHMKVSSGMCDFTCDEFAEFRVTIKQKRILEHMNIPNLSYEGIW